MRDRLVVGGFRVGPRQEVEMKISKYRDTSPIHIVTAAVTMLILLAACGPSESEIAQRLDPLRTESVLNTPPPGATVIGQFENPPSSSMFGSIESLGSVMTAWASTASYEELIEWYTTQFEGTYQFGVIDGPSLTIIKDAPTSSGNSVRVDVGSAELSISPFAAETYNQQTHPGMRFVTVTVGEFRSP